LLKLSDSDICYFLISIHFFTILIFEVVWSLVRWLMNSKTLILRVVQMRVRYLCWVLIY
jgi:hypothetical protein